MNVHFIDLDAPHDASVLSPAERARAARFRYETDRTRWIASRAALRRVLAEATGVAAEELELEESGKPRLVRRGCGVEFNLSHSGAVAMIAIASAPVGVDIEQVTEAIDIDAAASTAFTSEERAWLDAFRDAEKRREAFFRCWTRKEAWLKARGLGLAFDPRSFSNFDVPVVDVQAPGGYVAAMAT